MEKIDAYIEQYQKWKEQLITMRSIMCATELTETVKWGRPCYSMDKSVLISIVGFKNHCAVWFHQGVFLKDEQSLLVNAQEGSTKGLRQLRFGQLQFGQLQFGKTDKIDKVQLKAYVKETISNHRAGKKLIPERQTLSMPAELKARLSKDMNLTAAFNSLSPGKQLEYAEHVASAKQEKTRITRAEKAIPLILKGLGLYDKALLSHKSQ
ncbi:MAG: DUF1801 domain-containing protein [Pseudohongiellaceae bacterium]